MTSTDDGRGQGARRLDSLPAAAFLLLLIVLAFHRVISADLWLHLTAGRWILEHFRVPREDVFSFTAAGHRWIDLHWGYQLLVTGAHRAAGLAGVQLLHTLALLGTGLLVLRILRADARSALGALFGGLVLIAGQERILNRPETFTAFFLVATWWASERLLSERPPARRLLWLQVAWANMQGLFILGPALLLARAAGAWIDARRRPGTVHPAGVRRLLLAATAALGVSVLTPYGLDGWLLPFRLALQVTGESIYAPILAELRSPFLGRGTPVLVGAVMLLSGIAWALGRRRFRDLLPMLAFGVLACSARRNVLLFGWIVLIPTWITLARAEARLPRRWATGLTALGTALLLLLTAYVAGGRVYHELRSTKTTGIGASPHDYPTGTVAFLTNEPGGGRLYNMLGDGDYFLWHLSPRWRIAFDGRAEVYGEALGRRLLASVLSDAVFADVVNRYDPEVVTMDPTTAVGRAFVERRHADPAWALVFLDHRGAVFLPAASVDSTRVVTDVPWRARALPEARPLPWWQPVVRFPFTSAREGQVCAALGFFGRAANAYADAIHAFPHVADLYADGGAALLRLGSFGEATHAFENARALDPDHDGAAAGLARVREARGDRAGALRALAAWCEARPRAERAWLTLANMQLRGGDGDGALGTLERAVRRIPAATLPYARLLASRGDLARARDVLEPYVRQHGADAAAAAFLSRVEAALAPGGGSEKVDVGAP